jgi:amphi-Trp domain-containing protein
MPELEQKEKIDRARFVSLLRDCLAAIEQNQSFNVSVNGDNHVIPSEAFDKGWYRVEYEIDKGEHEFELTLKWR